MAQLRRGVLSGEIVKNVTLGRRGGGLWKEECKYHVRARQSRAHLLRLPEKLTKRGKPSQYYIYRIEDHTQTYNTAKGKRGCKTRAQADYQRKLSRLTDLKDQERTTYIWVFS